MSHVRAKQLAMTIKFKEYLLGRDVQSRRVLLDFFSKWALQQGGMPEIVAWFEIMKTINPTLNTMKSDVHWDELLLAYSHESEFLQIIARFIE